jgi:hypothetical protein
MGIKQAALHDIDWIFFLDADDLMVPSAFEYVSPYLSKYDAIWGSIWVIEQNKNFARERLYQVPFLYSIEDVLFTDPFVTLQMGHFIKTKAATSTMFKETLDTSEDFDYYIRVWEKFKCIKIPLPFFYNRRGYHSQGPKSATGSEWRQQVEKILREKRQKYHTVLLESQRGENSFENIRIGEKIRHIYPSKSWNRIEQEKQKLMSFYKPITPVSFIRLGDGELWILKNRNQLAHLLATSIKKADLVGLPDHYDGNIRNHIYNWDKLLFEYLRSRYSIQLYENNIISSYIFLYAPEIIGEFIRGKKVLWITANSEKIVNNLKNELFRSYYNLHDISKSRFIEIPESDGALPYNGALSDTEYIQIVQETKNFINKQQEYDIALVGAGVLGKIYCHIIKTDYGKQALDIGCLMSAYKGVRNRLIFKNGGELDFLVWDQ